MLILEHVFFKHTDTVGVCCLFFRVECCVERTETNYIILAEALPISL